MAFALVALLGFRHRPVASALPFALGLLSKASAVFVLPMAAVLCWIAYARGERPRAQLVALGIWSLILAVYVPIQFLGFDPPPVAPYPDTATLVRTLLAIGARYVAMAASGFGVSAFHEPAPVVSNLDPWWLVGLVLAPLIVWRFVIALRRRSVEAAWWIGAATAYAPVSQVVPFFYPMADRWLYFVLPGLLVGALFMARDLRERLAARLADGAAGERARTWLSRAGVVAAALLVLVFGVQARERAKLWHSADQLHADTASHYPEGTLAHITRAYGALEAGDEQAALAHLHSIERGRDLMFPLSIDPRLAPLQDDPRFQAFARDHARRSVLYKREQKRSDQLTLLGIAEYLFYLDELDEAVDSLEEALRRGGPLQGRLSARLIEYNAERSRRRRAAPH
jgi:hypothetical protein